MSKKQLKHIVLFRFNDSANEAYLEQIHTQLMALQDTVDELQAIEGGTDVSTENLNDGFSHCYIMTFASIADKDSYLQHASFQAFGDLLKQNLEKIMVMDYWTE
jgi:hypothetical protein